MNLTALSVLATASLTAAEHTNVFAQVLESRGVVLAVLVVLVILSLICWFVIGYKLWTIGRAIRHSRRFVDSFRSAARLAELYEETDTMKVCPANAMFRAGYEELELILREREGREEAMADQGDGPSVRPMTPGEAFENIERTLRQASRNAVSRLEYAVGFLATVGSAGPFIGLFGTVWGIMNAFAYIDPSRPILETVTPHIAEALVATAVGLLAAIPAVMAYNWLTGRLAKLDVILEDFSVDYLNVLRRHFFS